MHKLLVFYPKPADAAAFMTYYVERHLPLALDLPGLRSSHFYRPEMLSPGDGVFLIWEGIFDSTEAMFLALKSEAGKKVARDVPNYSPAGATMLHFGLDGGA